MNLIGEDIKIMRQYYDEALAMQGIPCSYQFPLFAGSNEQGEPVIDSYSVTEDTHIFFDGNPKLKTYKRYGWVVENDKDLPFLVHCSFHLHNVQKDCLFTIAGQYSGLKERVFRVTEITMDMQCPDHIVCQVVPVYDKQTVGRTPKEVAKTFSRSNHFFRNDVDYRGVYQTAKDGDKS
ncbi:hypothetical protein [Ruminococcus sp.]|uniref:hypothetical protein n=1 Tax=Ruminococcus sp. TaxID=41978 RepID=UPI001B6274CF|nr:hypothetical protein [Ruminococcus sp.]MBP5433595.1 hypothetical protein [Ruminococcus sp.]